MLRRLLLLSLAFASFLAAMSAVDAASAASPAKKVLILNSYHAGYKGSDDLVQGISEVLRKSLPSVDIKVEYLDSKNYSGAGYDAWVLDMLRLKYQGKRFDLLLSTDDYAFDLLEQEHDTVFKSTPLVFCGTNDFDRNRLEGRPHVVGVDEKPSFEDTIGLILSLHPDTRNIVAIHDISETGRLNNQDFQEAAQKYASRVEFSSLAGKSLEELLAAVGSLQPGEVAVYFASFVADKNDARVSSVDALRQIAAASRIPVYGGWEFNLGHGIVGGRLIDLREHGAAAGRLAVRILEGAGAAELTGLEPSPNRYMFDYTQLQRFNIATSKLPADSLIIKLPQTFFDKHGVVLLSALSALLSIAVLVALAKLLISRRDLDRSRQKFATIFRASPDPIAILDQATGRTLEINDAFTRILGYAAAEVTGRTPTEHGMWIAPEEQARMLAALGSGVRLANHEALVRKKGGEGMPALLSLEKQRIDQKEALLVTARDITERKQAEQALQAREDRFRLLFDRAGEGIVIISAEGDLISANEVFARMHGYTKQEMQSLNLRDLDTPEALRLMPERVRRILSGEHLTFEAENYHKDGHAFPIEVSASLIVSDGERLIQSFVRDITERKQVQQAREALEAQLRESQKMEALGTLAGGVAHDFNNALAAILGNVELARQDVGPGHAAQVSLDEIGKASRRAKDLVQQILAFGRRQKLERKVMALALVVVETARLVRATLPAMVSLSVDCKGDTPPVLADATAVKQILLNLCGNAAHAVRDQKRPGVIEVHLEAHTQGAAQGSLRPGRYACLSVRDNGPGMDEAVRAHIFEPFFTTKQAGEGTGLGLSVVHGMVQAHEASIEVESAAGAGSTFRIYFPATEVPLAHATATATATATETAPVHGKGKRVLYLDDEEAIIFLMQRLLQRRGYRVTGYTDPKAALAAVRADPGQFDLAVTDYYMPGMSGLEVAQALKNIRPDLPVLMASGYISEELRAKAPAVGIRELIYKPNTVEDLCEAVARFANAQSVEPSSF